jgi:hypothetical protein
VDVGCQGKICAGGVFRSCKLKAKLGYGSAGFLLLDALTGRNEAIPYCLVIDEAFPSQENMKEILSGMHSEGSIGKKLIIAYAEHVDLSKIYL